MLYYTKKQKQKNLKMNEKTKKKNFPTVMCKWSWGNAKQRKTQNIKPRKQESFYFLV